MAQLVEHILGKDEVPGPNPGSSSRHPRDFISGLWLLIGENPSFRLGFFYSPCAKFGVSGAATLCRGGFCPTKLHPTNARTLVILSHSIGIIATADKTGA